MTTTPGTRPRASSSHDHGLSREHSDASGEPPRLVRVARGVAATWSVAYTALGALWLTGHDSYPFDHGAESVETLALLSRGSVSLATIVVGVLGLVLLALGGGHPRGRALRDRRLGTAVAIVSIALAALLAVVVPDMRVLAMAGYLPMLLIMVVVPGGTEVAIGDVLPWSQVNQLVLVVAGLAFGVHGVATWRQARRACRRCGRDTSGQGRTWWTPGRLARWSRASVAVAIVVPVGYAVTRYAWALGVPLGISADTLEEIREILWAGAGLATGAMIGAVLTLGLVQRWGEQFPRWLPVVGGRSVPVALAVVPAAVVSVMVMAAGLMFVRLAVTGEIAVLPGEVTDVAAWLPELFWPAWAAGLGTATYAYWLRRRPRCGTCGGSDRIGMHQ